MIFLDIYNKQASSITIDRKIQKVKPALHYPTARKGVSNVPPRKTFRAVVCSILAILVFIHTTPLYAADSGTSGTESGTSEADSSSPPAGETATAVTAIDPLYGSAASVQCPSMYQSTGAAAYSVPIEVPKGRGDIAPNLSLTYNSYSGNGWVGVGWMLDMGAIQRSTKGLDYSSNDYAATVNGSVAELVARTDWGNSHYGNKIEGAFLNYYLNSSTGSWEVRDKSGTVYYYGSDPDNAHSRQENGFGTFKWLLDRVEDVNGNYMTLKYWQDQGEVYLEQVDYTGNTNGLPTTNQVFFDRASRTDMPVSLASRAVVKTAYRLLAIRVFGNGQQAGTYQLNYAYSAYTSRSILQSVTQYGRDGTSALPPVTFQWRNGATGFTLSASKTTVGASPVNYKLIDLNGDGKADLIYETSKTGISSNFRVLLSTGDGFGADTLWGSRNVAYNTNFKRFQLADINSDYRPDLIHTDSSNNLHAQLNTGTGFSTDTIITGVSVDPGTDFQMADATGDGIPDLIYDHSGQILVLRGDGSSGFTSYFSATRATAYNPDQKRFLAADMNGDGRADVLYEGDDSKIHVLLSTGSAFEPDTVWRRRLLPYDTATPPYLVAPYRLADVNGDGLPDFVYNGWNEALSTSEFHVLINRGGIDPTDDKGFEIDSLWGTRDYPYYWGATSAWSYFQLADLNGDEAISIFKAGIMKGMFSDYQSNISEDMPKYILSVDSNEEVYEAKIGLGGYHGYRLGEDYAMRKVVLEAWKKDD